MMEGNWARRQELANSGKRVEVRGKKRAGRWMRQVRESRGENSDWRRGGELGGGTSVGGGGGGGEGNFQEIGKMRSREREMEGMSGSGLGDGDGGSGCGEGVGGGKNRGW